MRALLVVLLALTLTACGASIGNDVEHWEPLKAPEFIRTVRSTTISEKTARYVANRTYRSYSSDGNQIEYMSENGGAYLWYPRNRAIVQGEWKIERGGAVSRDKSGFLLCFRYKRSSGKSGYGPWGCRAVESWMNKAQEIVSGDPLHLQKRLPFVLHAKPPISIGSASARIGGPADVGPNLVTWRHNL